MHEHYVTRRHCKHEWGSRWLNNHYRLFTSVFASAFYLGGDSIFIWREFFPGHGSWSSSISKLIDTLESTLCLTISERSVFLSLSCCLCVKNLLLTLWNRGNLAIAFHGVVHISLRLVTWYWYSLTYIPIIDSKNDELAKSVRRIICTYFQTP